MESCVAVIDSFGKFPRKLGKFLFSGPIETGKLCYDYAKKSPLHGCWTYPLNAVVCIASIAFTPLVLVISLIAALILIPAPLCGVGEFSCEWYQKRIFKNFLVAFGALIMPFVLLYAIIYPSNAKIDSDHPDTLNRNRQSRNGSISATVT